MAITPLPTPPTRDDPANFATRADTFLAALPDFATEANALATDVEGDATAAAASASAASTSASNAASSASAASTSASNAASSASAASSSASNAASSASAASSSATAAANSALALIATSTTSLSIGTGSKTFTTQSGKQFVAGAYVFAVSQGDASKWMFGQITSYTATTLVVDVSATQGSGSYADWSITLSGIRGATGAQGPGGTAAVFTEFTSSGTYTKDPGASFIMVEAWGAGGGGGSGRYNATRSGGRGGGGGAYTMRVFKASDVPSSVAVAIGAGGAGGTAKTTAADGNTGSYGGNTTFGSLLTAYGGVPGGGGTNSNSNGGPGGGVLAKDGAPNLTYAGVTNVYYGGFGSAWNSYVISDAGSRSSGWGGGSGGGSYASDTTGQFTGGGHSFQGGAGGGGGGGGGATSAVNFYNYGGRGGGWKSDTDLGGYSAIGGGKGGNGFGRRGGGGGGTGGAFSTSWALAAARKSACFNGSLYACALNYNGYNSYQGYIVTTANGTTGHAIAAPQTADVGFMLWDGSRFVLFSKDGTNVYTSTDLSTFTNVTGLSEEAFIQSVYYLNGRYFILGTSSGSIGNGVWTSTDLTSWTKWTLPFASNASLRGLAWTGTNYIVTVAGAAVMAYSPDGVTWTTPTGLSGVGAVYDVASDGSGTAVALVNTSPYAKYSTDHGASWSDITGATLSSSISIGSLFYVNSRFIAEVNLQVSSSTNGSSWTIHAAEGGGQNGGGGILWTGSQYIFFDGNATNNITSSTSNLSSFTTASAFSLTLNGGNGGKGGLASGGGGGGASQGVNSGAGGAGGNGLCRVYSW